MRFASTVVSNAHLLQSEAEVTHADVGSQTSAMTYAAECNFTESATPEYRRARTCLVCMRRGGHRQVSWTTETAASMDAAIAAAAAAGNKSRHFVDVLALASPLDLHVASAIGADRGDRPVCLSVCLSAVNRR